MGFTEEPRSASRLIIKQLRWLCAAQSAARPAMSVLIPVRASLTIHG